MKIVVIGGTGLIGSKTVAKLHDQGHEAVPASPDKKYAFEFDKRPWREVFEWLSDRTGLPVITTLQPTGTFTYVAKVAGGRKESTIPEIIDILNEALERDKFLLIRREASFTIVAADEKILSATSSPIRMR